MFSDEVVAKSQELDALIVLHLKTGDNTLLKQIADKKIELYKLIEKIV